MSTYLTVEGEFTFPNKERYEAAVATLQAGGWMDQDGFMLEESEGRRSDEPDAVPASLTINFPFGLYRNIGPAMDSFKDETTGQLIWTCTDGMFCGGVIRDGKETSFDLEEWAKEHEMASMPDPATDFDQFVEWMNEIEQAFMESYD